MLRRARGHRLLTIKFSFAVSYCLLFDVEVNSPLSGKFTPRYLLEIIEEIIADALMQVSALMTSHVVRLARIDEEVWLGACCDASLEEGEAVLWHYSHIVQALDNL